MNSYIVKAAGVLGSIAFAVLAGSINASADSTAAGLGVGTSFMNGLSAQHINVTVSENGSAAAAAPDVVKELIAQLKKENPQIEMNIYRSACKVNLATLISYKDLDGTIHSVLDN